MKRTDLIRKLEEAGCQLVRHGGNHDWYRNPKTGTSQPVPRHRGDQRVFGKTHPEETRELTERLPFLGNLQCRMSRSPTAL